MQDQLNRWQAEYSLPGIVRWIGFEELYGSIVSGYRMGRCNYRITFDGSGKRVPLSEIRLDKGLADAPQFFRLCVLWHEFCHARAYNEDTDPNDHDKVFYKYRKEKKAYWIGDMLLKLIGWVWCR